MTKQVNNINYTKHTIKKTSTILIISNIIPNFEY